MAHSPRALRLVSASVIAVLMVGGTFAFTGNGGFLRLFNIVEAQSSEELLREYAAKDSDTDGLPDWQEALYGTDPLNPESFQAGTKDGDAVAQGLVQPKVAVRPEDEATDIDSIPGTIAAPSSLTDRFSQALMKQYLQNVGDKPPTSEEVVSFVEASIADLSAQSESPARFKASDVRISSETGTQALVSYAAQLETAFAENTVPTSQNELAYFADALKEDAAALEMIGDISGAYEDIANAVMSISVPAEARQSHLSLANALMHLSETNADMATLKTDPLRALMGIGLYKQHGDALIAAFANLHGIFSARQVSIPEGTAGYYIVKTAGDAAAAK